MATKNEYNGWYNYETWCVNLWMDNEQGEQERWRLLAVECWENARSNEMQSRSQRARYAFADLLQSSQEEAQEEFSDRAGGSCMFTDLLSAAMSEVNWNEIADAWLEGCGADEIEDYEPNRHAQS